MYVHAIYTGCEAQKNSLLKEPLGPGFDEKTAKEIVKLEIQGTSLQDISRDFCMFRGFNAKGEEVASKKVIGF